MAAKPLIARASFAHAELTSDQIARVAGGESAAEVGDHETTLRCTSQNPAWTVEPTWKNDRGDTKGVCTDW